MQPDRTVTQATTKMHLKHKLRSNAGERNMNKSKGNNNKRFLCKPEQFNPSILTSQEIQQLRLLEAWCAFGHNEVGKNLISILERITHKIHGKDAMIPSGLLKRYDWIHKRLKHMSAGIQIRCFWAHPLGRWTDGNGIWNEGSSFRFWGSTAPCVADCRVSSSIRQQSSCQH